MDYREHEVYLDCPECKGPVRFTIAQIIHGGPVSDSYSCEEYDRQCGCQLDGLPRRKKQPIDTLIDKAKIIAALRG